MRTPKVRCQERQRFLDDGLGRRRTLCGRLYWFLEPRYDLAVGPWRGMLVRMGISLLVIVFVWVLVLLDLRNVISS